MYSKSYYHNIVFIVFFFRPSLLKVLSRVATLGLAQGHSHLYVSYTFIIILSLYFQNQIEIFLLPPLNSFCNETMKVCCCGQLNILNSRQDFGWFHSGNLRCILNKLGLNLCCNEVKKWTKLPTRKDLKTYR